MENKELLEKLTEILEKMAKFLRRRVREREDLELVCEIETLLAELRNSLSETTCQTSE